MKKFAIIQFSVLAFVSGVVTGLVFFTGGIVTHHWNELSPELAKEFLDERMGYEEEWLSHDD